MLSNIRRELERIPDYPKGARAIGYEFTAPLDEYGHIESNAWSGVRSRCRMHRFRPKKEDDIGHLVHKPDGSWAFHYYIRSDDDESGYRFNNHAFRQGEYVSIKEEDELRTFHVVRIENLPKSWRR